MLILLAVFPLSAAAVADNNSVFDPVFASAWMLPIAASTYAADPTPCLRTLPEETELLKVVNVSCDPFDDKCVGFLAIVPSKKALVLAFRGTVGDSEFAIEILQTVFTPMVKFKAGGFVGPFFKQTFDAVWSGGLENALTGAISSNEIEELWITGHSLGASLAAISAATIAHDKLFAAEKIRLLTFGEPRTGNDKFVKMMDATFSAMHRVTHKNDLIVHVPLRVEFFKHHKTEIFYDNDMSDINAYVTCKGNEDKSCSNAQTNLTMDAHRHYYAHYVTNYGIAGCT